MKKSLPLPPKGLVRLPTVLNHYQISQSGFYQGIKDGIYPKPIKAGNKSFWRAEDIHELIDKISAGEGQA
jgi:prophage regulatory protein